MQDRCTCVGKKQVKEGQIKVNFKLIRLPQSVMHHSIVLHFGV